MRRKGIRSEFFGVFSSLRKRPCPGDKVFAGYSHIEDIGKVSPHWLERIGHFFQHYKDLEKDKWVKLDGWGDAVEAKAILMDSIARYDATADSEKPKF